MRAKIFILAWAILFVITFTHAMTTVILFGSSAGGFLVFEIILAAVTGIGFVYYLVRCRKEKNKIA